MAVWEVGWNWMLLLIFLSVIKRKTLFHQLNTLVMERSWFNPGWHKIHDYQGVFIFVVFGEFDG